MIRLHFAVSMAALLLAGCGASHDPNGEADADTDVDTDADSDSDTRPDCPDDPQIPIVGVCATDDDCDPTRCVITGGVCVEEQWICGACDGCFYNRINHLDPPDGWECDADRLHCVPR